MVNGAAGVSGIGPKQGPAPLRNEDAIAFRDGEIIINPRAQLTDISVALSVLVNAKAGKKGIVTLEGRTMAQLVDTIGALLLKAKGKSDAAPIVLGELTNYTINDEKGLNTRVLTAAPSAANPFARKTTTEIVTGAIQQITDRWGLTKKE